MHVMRASMHVFDICVHVCNAMGLCILMYVLYVCMFVCVYVCVFACMHVCNICM